MTITEFLLARIAEDEAVARAASPSPWEYPGIESVAGGTLYDATRRIADVAYELRADHDGSIVRHLLSDEADANGGHIARHDPAHVLAECAAKRAIVERYADDYERVLAYRNTRWEDGMNDDDRINRRLQEARTATGYEAVRHLAAVYADHPDYDQAWRI